MGEIEKALLEYYRNKNKENPDLLSPQEISEWIWLECKLGIEEYRTQLEVGQ